MQNRFHSDLTSFLSKALQTEGIDNPKIIKVSLDPLSYNDILTIQWVLRLT